MKRTDLKDYSGLEPNEKGKYTVPAIYHVPTNTYMMDSVPISKFLETTYPDPPVQLTSELGDKVVAQLWAAASSTFRASIMPREVNILYPRSAEYFRRTHMGGLADLSPKELLDPQKEDEAWKAVDGSMREAGEMMQKNKADGPFVLGASPSYADFKIVAALQSGRMVDEGIFQRMVAYPGFKEVYKACEPYREKRN